MFAAYPLDEPDYKIVVKKNSSVLHAVLQYYISRVGQSGDNILLSFDDERLFHSINRCACAFDSLSYRESSEASWLLMCMPDESELLVEAGEEERVRERAESDDISKYLTSP